MTTTSELRAAVTAMTGRIGDTPIDSYTALMRGDRAAHERHLRTSLRRYRALHRLLTALEIAAREGRP